MKPIYKINLLVFFIIATSVGYLFSYSNGITGQSSSGCNCHGGGSASSNTTLTVTSASGGFSVGPGSTLDLTIKVKNTTGLESAGINIAVKDKSSGGNNVGSITAGTNLKKSGSELIHSTKGGPDLDGNGEATFEFEWTAPSSPGTYYIQASGNVVNGSGTTDSGDQWNKLTAKEVIVKGVTLTSLKGGQELCAGGSTNITWENNGLTNVKIELSTNGGSSFDQTIVSSTSASSESYSWSIPGSLSGSSYRIRISDASDASIKDQSTSNFTIAGEPEFTSQPQDQDKCTGESMNLSVAVEGSNLTYQWYKDGSSLSGKTQATLSISSLVADDAGDYHCAVTSECGDPIESDIATVSVTVAPKVVSISDDKGLCEGDNYTMTVDAEGDNITYQWYKENELIANATNESYSITDAKQSDDARYKVEINSPTCGKVTSKYVRITVLKEVEITQNPTDKEVCEGETLELSIIAIGTSLQYKWYKDDEEILNALSNSYSIMEFSPEDAGEYKCLVKNSCGEVFSEIANVTLKPLPVITSKSQDKEILEGNMVTFSVVVENADTEEFTYEWYHEGELVTDQSGKDLIINDVKAENEGNYTCKVYNDCGFTESEPMNLKVLEQGSGGILSLSEEQINFGEVNQGTLKEMLFEEFFKNVGDDEIQVTSVSIQSGSEVFTLKEIFGFTLEPEETMELLVKFRPTEAIEYFDTLLVFESPEGTPKKIPIYGKGLEVNNSAEVVANVNLLDFEDVAIDDLKELSFILENKSTENVATINSIDFTGTVFSLTEEVTLPIEIQPSSTLELFVKFAPTAEGEFTEDVIVSFDNAEDVEVELTGTAIPLSVANFIESIDVYPNPSNNSFNIRLNSKDYNEFNIEVYDLNGNMIYDFGKKLLKTGENNLEWNGLDYNGKAISKGSYTIIIYNESVREVSKIIVK